MANVWHEFDHSPVLETARRLLKPGLAPCGADHGPPLAHRIAASAAEASLKRAGLRLRCSGNIGGYSWLLVAEDLVSTT